MVTHTFKHSFLFLICHSTCAQKIKKFSALELIPGYVFKQLTVHNRKMATKKQI